MKSSKSFYMFAMTALLFFNIHLLSAMAVEKKVEVLVIQPEKLPDYNFRHRVKISRDPFRWSVGFRRQFDVTSKDNKCLEPISGFTLQSIIWGRNAPQAIINNKLVGVGSHLKEVLIERITKTHVVIKKDGCSRLLEFNTRLYDFSNKDGVKN
ncbi:hypothetical protein ACOHYD_01890 [Desulfobacterota bacterium M19]